MSSNSVKITHKTHQIEPTENMTDHLVHTPHEEANKDLYYFSNKEKCARCKQQGYYNKLQYIDINLTKENVLILSII